MTGTAEERRDLTRRMRRVHRAVADLRRGTPVVLLGPTPLVVLAAETAGAEGLAEFAALRGNAAALLLLAPSRAGAILGRPQGQPIGADETPVALRLHESLFDPRALRTLADPIEDVLLVPEMPKRAHSVPDGAEAALALAKLARLLPAAVIAPAAMERRTQSDILDVPSEDVLAYPTGLATHLARVADARIPLADAPEARLVAFRAPDAGIEHLAILVGRPEDQPAPLTRLHSECFTGDLLDSLRCDCGPQLRGALRRMGEEGHGVLLYLAQEGRGIGLVNKLRAYTLQDQGLDTLDANRALGWGADERNFLIASAMLEALEIKAVRLLTNNPQKLESLAATGVTIVGREPHSFAPNGVNDRYLATKAARFGHLLDF
jgi:GTP cyclohydrolase II